MKRNSGCFLCTSPNAEEVAAPEPQERHRSVPDAKAATLSRRSLLHAAGGSVLLAGTAGGARKSVSQRSFNDTSNGFVLSAGWALVEANSHLQLLRDAHVLVRNGTIEAVRARPFTEQLPRLQYPGDLLLPGFISGHTHVCSATPTRGIIESPRSYRRPLELVEKLSDEEMDALTAINLAELLRSGCTTQVEMSLSLRQAESYVRVADRWGVRGYPGPMIPDVNRLFPIWFRDKDKVLYDSESGTLQEVAASLAFAKKHMHRGSGRIQPIMSPHACDTHTPATLAAIAAAMRELKTGLHIHLSQGQRETDTVRRLWGKTPTQWLEEMGLLDVGPVFGAHMSGLDWELDPPVLNRHGVVYAHCPSAGGAGHSTQPYPEALAAAMQVNIAIDTHSNDYLENLKLAVLYGQARHSLSRELAPQGLRTRAPTVWDGVDAATRIPARGLLRDDLGVIKPGARADLVSIDVSGLLVGSGALPPEPLNNLLYANGRMVRTVVTDGQIQVHEGQFIADDVDRVLEEGGQVVQKIWAQLQSESWFSAAQTS
ncbi:MAG: amidohydrolase family protein [Congregibacter sp.]